jgi:hypothetical protein
MDIETMSTRTNAVVLSIGICFFDDEKLQSFDEIVSTGVEFFFDAEDQAEQKDRHIDISTLNWWQEQGEEARRCFEPEETLDIRQFHPKLEAVCEAQDMSYNWVKKYCRWFTRGPHFDIAIMDSLFADYGVTAPWKFFKVRDIRTWLECHGLEDNIKLKKPESMIPHNALHDAAFDAYMMQQCLHRPFEELELEEKERK